MTLRHLVLTGALSVLLNLGLSATLWFGLLRPPAMVTFDLRGTMDAFITQSARLDLTDEQRHRLLIRFNHGLASVTTQYALDEHVSILVSPAVVTGLPDATPAIRQRLAQVMSSVDHTLSDPFTLTAEGIR